MGVWKIVIGCSYRLLAGSRLERCLRRPRGCYLGARYDIMSAEYNQSPYKGPEREYDGQGRGHIFVRDRGSGLPSLDGE